MNRRKMKVLGLLFLGFFLNVGFPKALLFYAKHTSKHPNKYSM